MEYKVLVKIFVPEIEQEHEVYIPINKTILEISILINKMLHEKTNDVYPIKDKLEIINRSNGVKYKDELILRNTDIRNSTQLVVY